MKVFISQLTRGRSEFEILTERARITEFLMHNYDTAEIINSYFTGSESSALDYLGESIKLLAQADAVCFAPNFKLARVCRIEYQCCLEYAIPIIYYKEEK